MENVLFLGVPILKHITVIKTCMTPEVNEELLTVYESMSILC